MENEKQPIWANFKASDPSGTTLWFENEPTFSSMRWKTNGKHQHAKTVAKMDGQAAFNSLEKLDQYTLENIAQRFGDTYKVKIVD